MVEFDSQIIVARAYLRWLSSAIAKSRPTTIAMAAMTIPTTFFFRPAKAFASRSMR